MEMYALDLTAELAPLFWTMEGLMLIAVAWLVGMFFADQLRPKTPSVLHGSRNVGAASEPVVEPDHRMAA